MIIAWECMDCGRAGSIDASEPWQAMTAAEREHGRISPECLSMRIYPTRIGVHDAAFGVASVIKCQLTTTEPGTKF